MKKPGPLSSKYEDILLLVQENLHYVKTISKRLHVSNSTIADRIKKLVKEGFLYKIPKSYPYFYELTQAGKEYLKINFTDPEAQFTDPLRLGEVEEVQERGIEVFLKNEKTDQVSFDSLRFSETLEKYLGNLPKNYPKNSFLASRPHWVTYKFDILQQSKFLTRHCRNEFGVLANQDWVTVIPMGPKEKPTWYKYQGSVFFYDVRYFVTFTPGHCIVRFQTFFASDPVEAAYRILMLLYIAKRELEDQLSIDETPLYLGSINPVYVAHCIISHLGIVLQPLSIICDQLGLVLTDIDKRLRIDASNDIPELETIDSGFSKRDAIFLFEDLVYQVQNNFRVQESHKAINDVQIHLNKLGTQCLVLEDKSVLANQRFNTIESNLELVSQYLAETTRELRNSTLITSSQFEKIDETLSSIETRLEASRIIPRTKLEQVILTFLQSTPNDFGFTRNFLAETLDLPLGSINAIIVSLRKQRLITIKKTGIERGRVFLVRRENK